MNCLNVYHNTVRSTNRCTYFSIITTISIRQSASYSYRILIYSMENRWHFILFLYLQFNDLLLLVSFISCLRTVIVLSPKIRHQSIYILFTIILNSPNIWYAANTRKLHIIMFRLKTWSRTLYLTNHRQIKPVCKMIGFVNLILIQYKSLNCWFSYLKLNDRRDTRYTFNIHIQCWYNC